MQRKTHAGTPYDIVQGATMVALADLGPTDGDLDVFVTVNVTDDPEGRLIVLENDGSQLLIMTRYCKGGACMLRGNGPQYLSATGGEFCGSVAPAAGDITIVPMDDSDASD